MSFVRICEHFDLFLPCISKCTSHNLLNYSYSLTFSHSGKSSLRSSTEDDERESSRNSSLCAARYTVLMMGAPEVGKSTLSSHFMSSCDILPYGHNDSIGMLMDLVDCKKSENTIFWCIKVIETPFHFQKKNMAKSVSTYYLMEKRQSFVLSITLTQRFRY